MRQHFLFTLVLLIMLSQASAQNIYLDESTADWQNDEIYIYEEPNDQVSGVDIVSLAIADDSEFLYLKLQLDREISLQENNSLVLNIRNQLQMSFSFGNRVGEVNNITVFHDNLGLVSSPTVTSNVFEIKLSKEWSVENRTYKLEGALEISITNLSSNGDELPGNGQYINYMLDESGTSYDPPSYNLEKASDTDFRFCSYNVLRDNIFSGTARNAYRSILGAIDADLYAFQEIYDYDAEETLTRLRNVFGVLDPMSTWYSKKRGSDNIIISKYPITYSRDIGGNGVFVVSRNGQDILIINIHLPCCERDREREEQIDLLLSFLRDSKNGQSNLDLKTDTPIIIAGDTNFVGFSDQVTAIMEGNIFNNFNNGPDFEMDWDNTGLTDAKAFATGNNTLQTWQSAFSSFFPGRLDYAFFSDAVLEALNSFTLDTETMEEADRITYSLKAEDNAIASDHLPIIVDFKIKNSTSVKEPLSEVLHLWPNPAIDYVNFDRSHDPAFLIRISDTNGRLMYSGPETTVDVSAWPEGIYVAELHSADHQLAIKKFSVIR